MSKKLFSQRMYHLLLTGEIEGEQLLRLHQLLQDFKRGDISVEIMQAEVSSFGLNQDFNFALNDSELNESILEDNE